MGMPPNATEPANVRFLVVFHRGFWNSFISVSRKPAASIIAVTDR
jgi:hypothetical protein